MSQNNICHYVGCKNLHKTKVNAIYCKTHYLADKQNKNTLTNIFSESGISNIIIGIKNEIERNTCCKICEKNAGKLNQCMDCDGKFCNDDSGNCGIADHYGLNVCLNCENCIECGSQKSVCRHCEDNTICPQCIIYNDENVDGVARECYSCTEPICKECNFTRCMDCNNKFCDSCVEDHRCN